MVSLGVFHGQEMGQFNNLSSMIKGNMYQLGQAIKGLIVMSGPLEDMYNCFLIQKVLLSYLLRLSFFEKLCIISSHTITSSCTCTTT